MFDFSKIEMTPGYGSNFELGATTSQIEEIEQYCGHALPENLKIILQHYNGGDPEARYFEVKDDTEIPGEMEISRFFILNDEKDVPANIWWKIKNYGEYMGPQTVPFASDYAEHIYYLKWVNDVPQVWYLAYQDMEGTETYPVKDSFDDLLEGLYAE